MTSPGPKIILKMSSLLNVSNTKSKSENFNHKDIEVLGDSKEQNWFKWVHVGKSLGHKHIDTSVESLYKCEMPTRNDIKTTPHGRGGVRLDLRIIKTRRINSSQSLGPCMSL